jgi:hypothetical protein
MNLGEFSNRLQDALGGERLPGGAMRRVLVLLGEEEVDYVTADLRSQDDGPVTGDVIVLTRTRVVRAHVSALGRGPDGPVGEVGVEAWSRSLLRWVSIPDSRRDDNEIWDQVLERWPAAARLYLSYGEGGRTITLPGSGAGAGNRDDLWALIPSLLDDLNK